MHSVTLLTFDLLTFFIPALHVGINQNLVLCFLAIGIIIIIFTRTRFYTNLTANTPEVKKKQDGLLRIGQRYSA